MSQSAEPASMRPLALFATVTAGIFVGGSGALLVQRALEPAEVQAAYEPTTSAAPDPKLAEALSELARELRTLRETRSLMSPPAVPSSEPSQRAVATESGDSALVELAAAVRELRGALANRETEVTSSAVTPSLPVLTRPRDNRRAWLPELPPEVEDRSSAFTRQYVLWTEQQILDHFGAPDRIGVEKDGSLEWTYVDPVPDGDRSFYVTIYQGRVIHVADYR
jgi:hypothetical protein